MMSYENKNSDTGNVGFGVQEDIDLGNKYALSISFYRLNFYMAYQVSALLRSPRQVTLDPNRISRQKGHVLVQEKV